MAEQIRIVCDTSIIIDGKIPGVIERMKVEEIIIPHAVLDELQAQASKGREEGFIGLDELKKIRAICEEKKIKLRFIGDRPSLEDIQLAKSGRLDALIRDVAKNTGAVLVTADYVQSLVGEAEGVKTEYIPERVERERLAFKEFFTEDTMSVHLKDKVPPLAKRGKPGNFKLAKIREKPCTTEELNKIIRQIVDTARLEEDSFIEINKRGAMVIQLREGYRIAIAKPPFSDGLEVTVVRPLVKLGLKDYRLSDKLMERLKKKAEGILVSGPPGSGKTTFVSSLADFYVGLGKIVKTFESPRDLMVGPEVTQYGPLEGDFSKTADIILLVRPDYTIFDEVRKTHDFNVFADMRLAGVGMVGVVHAAGAIDSVQRFIGRVELGMIPSVLDTIIFIKDGEIKNVYDVSLRVKVPTGMTEADLARPVVEIMDFETGKLEYEIYTFGEENVVVPIKVEGVSAAKKLAAERILQEIIKFDPEAEVKLVSDERAAVMVDNDVIARLIGKDGVTITKIEDRLGIHLDVEPRVPALGNGVRFETGEVGNCVELGFDKKMIGKAVSIYIDDNFIFSATIGKKGWIKVTKDSDIGRELIKALVRNKVIKAMV